MAKHAYDTDSAISSSASEDVVGSESDEETGSDVSEHSSLCTSSSKEMELSGDVIKDIQSCLDNFEHVGTFASFRRLDPVTDPQISIDTGEGFIPITIPLSEEGAQAITRASHQAPFGKGTETIVDTAVRKTWELNRNQFYLRNPQWERKLGKIVAAVAAVLGIAGGPEVIKADLYKMLLYEKGGMFKAHTDTEKVPGMFGTLVVALPSKHEGGAVVVQHNKERKIFRTEDFQQSYIFWYSDVKHEIQEVKAGYRWVLTYNLVHCAPEGERPSAARNCLEVLSLRDNLKNWRKDLQTGESAHRQLIYLLRHKYTDASLKLSALKGRDHVKAHILKDACDESDFLLYLASLERVVSGGAEEENYSVTFHKMEDVCEDTVELKRVVDLNGNVIAEHIDINMDDVVQKKEFIEQEPDDEEYEGWTGNEGASATHWYRETVLVIMPREYSMIFHLRPFQHRSGYNSWYQHPTRPTTSAKDLEKLVNGWLNQFIQDPRNERLKASLLEACDFMAEQNISLRTTKEVTGKRLLDEVEPFPDKILGLVVKASWLLKDPRLLHKAASAVEKRLPLDCFSDIGNLMCILGFSALREGIILAFNAIQTIHETYEAIQKTKEGDCTNHAHPEHHYTEFHAWTFQRMKEVMLNVKRLCQEDGAALAEVITLQNEGESLFDIIVDVVKQNAANTPFAVSFLATMPKANDDETKAWRAILSHVVHTFSVCPEPEPQPERHLPWLGNLGEVTFGVAREAKASINPQFLAQLLCDCLSAGDLDAEANNILEKVAADAERISTNEFKTMLLPFLRELIPVMQGRGLPLIDPRSQTLYQSVINAFVRRYVGKKPVAPPNWKRPRTSCNCRDCAQLNEFLVSPTERDGRFPMAEKRRRHLQQQLNGGDFKHETERRGSPQTLVITKTNNAFDQEYRGWWKRAEEAKQHFAVIGHQYLKELLGGSYEQLTQHLEAVRPPTAVPADSTIRPLSELRAVWPPPAQPQQLPGISEMLAQGKTFVTGGPFAPSSGNEMPLDILGTKRKATDHGSLGAKRQARADVVDLTGDE